MSLEETYTALGLTDFEYDRILELLGTSVLEDPLGNATLLRCSLGLSTLGAHGFTAEENS